MKSLNDIMEFDRVIRVHPDGSVTDAKGAFYFELSHSDDEPGQYHLSVNGDGWELLNGYSGQDRYRGPIMHASEFIGGGMARDILAMPGLYVALVCEVHECEECVYEQGELIADPECHGEHEPAGWAVAYLPNADSDE